MKSSSPSNDSKKEETVPAEVSSSSTSEKTTNKEAVVSTGPNCEPSAMDQEGDLVDDGRDDCDNNNTARGDEPSDERDERAPEPASNGSKASTSRNNNSSSGAAANNNKKKSKNNNGPNKGGGPYAYHRHQQQQQQHQQQPWAGAPYGPGPYGYPGAGAGPYGLPPPPPPHQYAPHPGMMQPQYNGYGNGNNGGNSGRGGPHPPPGPYSHHSHHPGSYSGAPPPYGMPYGMPYPGGNNGAPHNNNGKAAGSNNNSDSASVSSNRSSGSHPQQRKRTIDGLHHPLSHHPGHNVMSGMSQGAEPLPPSAYSFRRTDSNASSTSTVTAGNNTSQETTDESTLTTRTSTRNSTRSGTRADRMAGDLPPLFGQGVLLNDEQQNHPDADNKSDHHRRSNSDGDSTASSLSVGGFSLESYEGPRVGAMEDVIMTDAGVLKSSPKRRKSNRHKKHGSTSNAPLMVDIRPLEGTSGVGGTFSVESNRLEQLSIGDENKNSGKEHPPSTSSRSSNGDRNLFLSLSTSPINSQQGAIDVDATPVAKNKSKVKPGSGQKQRKDDKKSGSIFKPRGGGTSNASIKLGNSASSDAVLPSVPSYSSDTPTPPGEMGVMLSDDQSMLNRHLRGQSFTPLPHVNSNTAAGESTSSPSNAAALASGIQPQLSWSIAGDTPSLGDLAEWEEEHKSKMDAKIRPSSTTSEGTQNMNISPQDFQLWKEEHDLADVGLNGTTTPLPFFMDQPSSGADGRENHQSGKIRMDMSRPPKKMGSQLQQRHPHQLPSFPHPGDPTSSGNHPGSIHSMFNGGKFNKGNPTPMWSKNDQSSERFGMPPTPLFAATDFRDDSFAPSPMGSGDPRRDSMDFYPSNHMFHHPGHDRVCNLRGRLPPGSHLPPMPLHIPPHMASHLPMTSPMGLGPGKGMWSPAHQAGMHPLMASPHHMQSPLSSMAQSKRKCVPLKPPIPSKFQGDMDKASKSTVPEFTSLVNFPAHMSQKQAANLPDGVRCCVMCGSACPCSSGNKSKKNKAKNDGGLAPRNNNGQDVMGEKNGGYAIIPTQNKGLCTLCDVNVWVVVSSGLEIKWCKGCKNFRPWASFGDKGLATKCLRCRERQREKYALQKEEKEKARMMAKAKK